MSRTQALNEAIYGAFAATRLALSRDQIMNAVWGYGCMVTTRSIDRFVNNLRK